VQQAGRVAASIIALSGPNGEGANLAAEMMPVAVREVYAERLAPLANPFLKNGAEVREKLFADLYEEAMVALTVAMQLLVTETKLPAAEIADVLTQSAAGA